MDVQQVLDVALATGAANLGAPEAAKIFREQLASSLRVNVQLTVGQRAILKKMLGFPVVYTGGKSVTNDHPLLVAARDLTRDIFEHEFKTSVTSEKTLIIGASAREIKKYNNNPHIHYYVYGKENKDYDRIVRPALAEICKMLRQKAAKTDSRVFVMPKDSDIEKMRPFVRRYWRMNEVFQDYMNLHKLPSTIHLEPVSASTLIFEDSFYNFGPDDYVEIFLKTGAEIAYGYGMLPLELIFDELPDNPVYSVTRTTGGRACLVFKNGFCNGYCHSLQTWSTLLRSPLITGKNHPIQLAVEISSRVGPMCTFKIYRCRNAEGIVRSIELPEKDRYVKLLDIMACVNKRTGRVIRPFKYFSMNEGEFLDTLNYLLSLDPRSLTHQNTIAYIRRRMGGMSLITKELVEPWQLPRRLVAPAALVIYFYAKTLTEQTNLVKENIDIGSIAEKFITLFKKVGRGIVYPLALLWDWLTAGHLVDKLVLNGNDTSFQFVDVHPRETKEQFDVGLHLANPYEGDLPSCPVCMELLGKLGEQIVDCVHVEPTEVEVALTTEQLNDLKGSLIDTDNDHPGLANVKKRAYENLPSAGFRQRVKVFYIKAGPGCGKSYLIRQLATTQDLVMAPFTKLRPDYVDLKDESGESYDLLFKTTHRALETRGCRRIFVDEFTSMPYEYLACVAYLNGAEEIFLVGDDKQTKVQEPTEGMYIGNYIDLEKVSTHELLVNFRNPQDTVAMLNRIYGYRMQARSAVERSITFCNQETLPKGLRAVKMAFTKLSSKNQTEEEKNTVRANQGGTTSVAVLYCTVADGTTASVEELQIVGLSRHTEKLYIVTDGCDEAVRLQQKLQLDADFYAHLQTWLTFPTETVKPYVQADLDVEAIVRPQQPPKDMHLLLETMNPSVAYDDITTSMNLTASAVIPEDFRTGCFNPDLLIMPVNKRGHPQKLITTYYAHSTGVGNFFSANSPSQVLQVLQARYFNKQPFFELSNKQELLAKKMVNLWFSEHVRPRIFSKIIMDDAEVQEVITEFLQKVVTSHYQESFRANGGLENPDGRVIRFNLKGIFKPKFGVPDVYKAGQGISAWSTDACAMFCSVFRVLGRLVMKTENQTVMTDSYTPELDFMKRVKGVFAGIPSTAQFAVTDGVTFDANQNAFTQLIENLYWRSYDVPQDFLDAYYSFRKNYKVISSVAIGFAGTQKTSGEPGTLKNNEAVTKVTSNYTVRGDGPVAIVYKGDDFTKHQNNLVHDKARQDEVNSACALGLKVQIGPSAEFCGLTFCDGELFPSIPRKANKISAHRFKDYKHFCEYQTSLRDWVTTITKLGDMRVIALNSAHYKTDYSEMQSCFDVINSISHIDEEQFHEVFRLRREESVIPTKRDGEWEFITHT